MYSFILLAGGKGLRMGKATPKQFLDIGGKPIIMSILEKIEHVKEITEVIIVCANEYNEQILTWCLQYGIETDIKFTCNGNSRQSSVYSGLLLATKTNVILHEAARPFVTVEDYRSLINDVNENVTYALSIPFTVLKSDGTKLTEILDRNSLINVQLPQKYNRNILLKAHEASLKDNKEFTEDASMIFYYNLSDVNVRIGKDYNIKLTTPMDIIVGEEIYKEYFMGVK